MRRGLLGSIGGAVLALLLLNLFLATPIGLGMVAKKLSGALRLPVKVGSASYTPWGGVRLSDLRVEQVEEARAIAPAPFFEAASFSAEVRLLSLLSDEVVVRRLVCEAPKFSLVNRKESVPQRRPAGQGTATPGQPAEFAGPAGASKSKAAGTPALPTAVEPPPAGGRQRGIALGELEIRGGELIISSFEGQQMLRLEGLRLSYDFAEGGAAGRLSVGRAILLGAVTVEELVSPLQLAGRKVELKGLKASCEGGEIRGELAFERTLKGTPFAARLTASGIGLARLLEGKVPGLSSGEVTGEMALRGIVQSPRSIEGAGEIRVDGGSFEPGAGFEPLRSALEIDADGRMKLDPAELSFALRGGVLGVREASVGSGPLLVKSVGGVRIDGAVNVSTRLYLGADLYAAVHAKQVPGRAALEFERLEGTDWFFRDELVTGTLADPLVDFWRTGTPTPVAEVVRELSFDNPSLPGDAIDH